MHRRLTLAELFLSLFMTHPAQAFQATAVVAPRVLSTDRHAARSLAPKAFFGAAAKGLNNAASEEKLIGLVRDGATKREIIDTFTSLEGKTPAPDDLLLTADGGELINGRWKLLGTIAADLGEDVEKGVSNSINASGIVVDAAKEPRPVQEIDVARKRIANELYQSWPFGQNGIVRVAGGFAPNTEKADGRRAYVSFDSLEFFLESEGKAIKLFDAGFIFSLIRTFRPSLSGDADGPWLDTTYLTDRVRLGRGNKGDRKSVV